MVLAILQHVDAAAMAVCLAVDKAIEFEHKDQHALKELREALDSLKSETSVYKVHLNAIKDDTNRSNRSPGTRLIQRYVMGCSQAHSLTELIIYIITDRMEGKQWKTLKERSRLRD